MCFDCCHAGRPSHEATAPKHNVSTSLKLVFSGSYTELSSKPSLNHSDVHLKLKMVLNMCLLETLWVLQDISPLGVMCFQWCSWWLWSRLPSVSAGFLKILLTLWGKIFRLKAIDGHFIFLTFPNSHSKTCHLLTKLLVDCLLDRCSLVQVYSLVLNILWELFAFAHAGRDVGLEEADSEDRSALYS